MSKILVTGCLGTIGTPLCKGLQEEHDVYGIDLRHSELQKEFGDYRYHRCDIRNYRKLLEVISEVRPDYVYHLAAEFGRHNGEQYYEDLWSTNVIGTRNILEVQKVLQRINSTFRLIFASSSEVYGETVAEKFDEELTERQRIYHHNDYAQSKFVNEDQIQRFRKQHGIEAQILRFFNAYGPGESYHAYRSVICLFIYRLLHGLPITVFKNYHRVFMYIDDMIETLVKVPKKFIDGEIVNVGGKEYCAIEKATDYIVSTIARKKAYIGNGISYEKHLGNLKSLISYMPEDKHNTVNKMPDITKAEKLYGHNPNTPLERGIEETVDWMWDYYGFHTLPDSL